MKPRSDYERFELSSVENRRLLREEELILEATVALAQALEAEGMRKTELAQRLGKSRAFVTQILSGGRNLTLRTLADAADALGYQARLRLCKEGVRSVVFDIVEPLEPFSWTDVKRTRWAEVVVQDTPVRGTEETGAAA
jgi:transcriptional regulator with XRE-family HTH domain